MNQKKIQLAVIIINYKTPQLVIDCLASLLPELEGVDAKIVLVDNASLDNSTSLINAWINEYDVADKINLIVSKENSGFSGGNNTGIRHVKAKYYLLLNSDTLVRKGAVSVLLNAIEGDDTAGLVSPRLEWHDASPQESCFRFHSPLSELISSANSGPITKVLSKYNVPCPVLDKRQYYNWTSFACVLIRSEVFEDIGLMDDGYFMYFEDVSFAQHAHQAGWRILNVPKAHVVHLRGGSSSVKSQAKKRKRLPRYYYESRTRYFYQTYGQLGLLGANLLWSFGWGIASFRQLVSSTFTPSISEFQWKDIWTNFFNPIKPYIHPDNYDKT